VIHLRDAFIFAALANALMLCGTGCASLAYGSWVPMQVGLTITSTTFLTAAAAVVPLVWLNIRAAIGESK
jgi:hypothetical protein